MSLLPLGAVEYGPPVLPRLRPVSRAVTTKSRSPRHVFRVLTRTRAGYDGEMYDIQLQVNDTGALVWAQTFTDAEEADRYREEVEGDLESLDEKAFRLKWSVPSGV